VADLAALDAEIALVSAWARRAGWALLRFHDPDRGLFWRDTTDPEEPGATSTNRAFQALTDLLLLLLEERREGTAQLARGGAAARDEDLLAEVARVLRSVARTYATTTLPDGDGPGQPAFRESGVNQLNMFTDSHLLAALALLEALPADLDALDGEEHDRLREWGARIAARREQELLTARGGHLGPEEQTHDFITFAVLRGLDAFPHRPREPYLAGQTEGAVEPERPTEAQLAGMGALADRVEVDVLRQLAYYEAGITFRFDPAELAFSLALLDRLGVQNSGLLRARALHVLERTQSTDGAWPSSRVVSATRRLLYVASYEVALTLAIVARGWVEEGSEDPDRLLGILGRAFALVRQTHTTVGGLEGWASDRARVSTLLESWATAVVLSFLTRYRELLLAHRNVEVLRRYRSTPPSSPPVLRWPDAGPLVRARSRGPRGPFLLAADPTGDGSLSRAVATRYVAPAEASWIDRPRHVTLALAGPPDAAKTALVRALADRLAWPLLVLTPADFLVPGGLDLVEARAAEVFDDLGRLRRVVVLLDDCEVLFQAPGALRPPPPRRAGALLASGMLSRLRELRDRRSIVLVLPVDQDPDLLDPRVRRPGRFDEVLTVGHPDLAAQRRYVGDVLGATATADILLEALDLVREQVLRRDAEIDRGSRAESDRRRVSFDLLSVVLEEWVRPAPGRRPATARLLADEIWQLLEETE